MGQFLEEIPQYLIEWLLKQEMFWVASAPLSSDGHVNISPKAIEGTFHVVNSRRVWYEDLSGTGAETVAHIRENGRITILFHAFEGPARIVRLYGKGFFHEIGSPEYEALLPPEKRIPGSRAIIGLDVHKVGTTCGYAVPYYKFLGHRTQLVDWAAKKEDVDAQDKIRALSDAPLVSPSTVDHVDKPVNPDGMKHWWKLHNLTSLDGLPAFSLNLGKGFPFSVSLQLGHRNAPPSYSNTSRRAMVNASSARHPTAFQGIEVKVDSSSSPFQHQERIQHQNFVPNLLLLLLAFIMGVLLDRYYSHYVHQYHQLGLSHKSLLFHIYS